MTATGRKGNESVHSNYMFALGPFAPGRGYRMYHATGCIQTLPECVQDNAISAKACRDTLIDVIIAMFLFLLK